MSYISRIQKAIDHIEANLKNEIKLIEVAQVAMFSPFHFHKVFSSCVGETIKTYIRKRRLTEAAYELRNTKKRVLDIAIDYQFESQESFSRAFKKHFNETPAKYRNLTRFPNFFEKKVLTKEAIMHRIEKIELNPRIKHHDPFWAIGMEYSGSLEGSGEIPKLWDKFVPKMKEISNPINQNLACGICYASKEMIQVGQMNYLAAIPTTDNKNVPKGMKATKVEGGKYLVLTHVGPISKFGLTVDYIYKAWLPKSDYEMDDRADFEIYDERFKDEEEDSEVDIYIPIK